MKEMKKLKDTKAWEKLKKSEYIERLLSTRLMKIVTKTKLYLFFRYRFFPHLYSFWIPWTLLVLMLLVAITNVPWKLGLLSLLMLLFVVTLVFASMNVIHGLIGTRGDIRMFFFMFLVINLLFATIYYCAFFKNAGITYDVSQPHVEFNIFEKCGKDADFVIVEQGKNETVILAQGMRKQLTNNGWIIITPVQEDMARVESQDFKMEHVPTNHAESSHYYHRINRVWVLQNTLLTSFMQEPTEFYSFTCTYNGSHEAADRNVEVSRSFHWFLVFHILISWIFLGVFISLIYQKFRNN